MIAAILLVIVSAAAAAASVVAFADGSIFVVDVGDVVGAFMKEVAEGEIRVGEGAASAFEAASTGVCIGWVSLCCL